MAEVRSPAWFDAKLNLNGLMTVFAVVIGGVLWVAKQDNTALQLAALSVKVDALGEKVANIPVDRIAVVNLERRITGMESKNVDQDIVISRIDHLAIELKARLDSVSAATGVQLNRGRP